MKLNFNQLRYFSEAQGWMDLTEDGGKLNKKTENQICTKSLCRLITVSVVIFAMMVFVSFFLLISAKSIEPQAIQDKVISCYYNTPTTGLNDSQQLLPSQIPPHLCTHINVAFAKVVGKQIYLEPSQYEALKGVVNLKQANSELKVLLSVGGAGENNGFSEMVKDHASRKVFIRSIKSILRNHSLDGIDLDWEFPALHSQKNGRERQHFSQLLREIRMEYIREKKDYLLTVALAAPEVIVDVSYDVDQINLYVDFANIMTYDFHYFSKFTPFTGLNSPLYARSDEELYLATLNINYTVGMYTRKGLDEHKIVVGIPTYGHTFELVNEGNPRVGAPAAGVGAVGARGFASYPEVCTFLSLGGARRWERAARVPYAYRGREWLSFESPRSAAAKAQFVAARALRGAMLYSLNADDHAAHCSAGGPFVLARAVRGALLPPAPALQELPFLPFSSSRRR